MTQTQQFDADVAGVEPEGTVDCKFEGSAFIGQRTPVKDSTALAEAGLELALDLMLVVRLSQFTAPRKAPTIAKVIEVEGVPYDIKTVEPDQYGVATTYGLKQSS